MALIFKNAEEVKDAITASQKKEIAKLYEDWADEIGERAKFYSHKTTASSVVSERQMKELQKMIIETGNQVSNEVQSKIKGNIYTIADAVVADNVKWLESFGFSAEGLNAAFSSVPNDIVQRLVTGQIYEGGWNLSTKIWGDNQQTMKDAYQIMARGLTENKPIYAIAKDLESYVRPSAKLPWNPVLAMKNTKTGKIEYKRIYKSQVDYNAQRLARTLAQHSYQQSLLATTQNNPFITEYIWHSNGSRVCKLCEARDGVHYKKNELPMDHPNGMCIVEPAVAEDMVDQLAEWVNSPDGTFPEIDDFAGNFGYTASKSGTVQDFVNKYGTSTKNLKAWKQSLSPAQKAEAKLLKEQSGLTWEQWYEKNIYSGSADDLAAYKAKKEAKKAAKKAASKADDAFEMQLKKAGFTNAEMPKNLQTFEDWYLSNNNVDYDKLVKLSKMINPDAKGIDFDALEKYFDDYIAKQTAKASTQSLDDALAAAQKKLNSIPNKKYSGIWQDDVTLADYEAKASSIAKKKQYYKDQIAKYSGDAYSNSSWAPGEIAKFQKYLDDLDEFEKLGKQYAAAQKDYKAAKLAVQKAKGPTAKFDASEYTDEAKATAKKFTSPTAADKFHRPYLDEVWEEATDYERYSVWEYTQNSNPINKSLSGYHDGWSRYDFRGLGNTDLGHEDAWRHFNTSAFETKYGVNGHKDYKSVVQNLTNVIEKSEMPESVYLVRGSDKSGLAGLLEGDFLSFDDAKRLISSGDTNAIKAALEGQTFTNHSFMSTGISQGTGFSGEVSYEIFAPKGTHAIYAEPASYYGNTIIGENIYKVGQSYSSIGGEAEIIIQRGTDFRITDVVVDSYDRITIKMEVVNQPGYFTTGLEHTHNGGLTSYVK